MCNKFMHMIGRKFCCVYVEKQEEKEKEEDKTEEEYYSVESRKNICVSTESLCSELCNNFLPTQITQIQEEFSTELLCSELCNNFLPTQITQTQEELKLHTSKKKN